MDTREKIIDLSRACTLSQDWQERGVTWRLVTGYFDVLTPDHVRGLEVSRNGSPLIAAVLDKNDALLPIRARAELAASLRVVDYVLLLESAEQLESAIERLQPPEVMRGEAADQRRAQALIEHVHRRQQA